MFEINSISFVHQNYCSFINMVAPRSSNSKRKKINDRQNGEKKEREGTWDSGKHMVVKKIPCRLAIPDDERERFLRNVQRTENSFTACETILSSEGWNRSSFTWLLTMFSKYHKWDQLSGYVKGWFTWR